MSPNFQLDSNKLQEFLKDPVKFLNERMSEEDYRDRSSGTLPYDEKRLADKAKEETVKAQKLSGVSPSLA